MPNYYCEGFPQDQTYQYLTLAPGASGTIFLLDIPPKYFGFLERVANRWYNDTYLDWKIDGKLIERVRREFAIVGREPYILEPPFIIKKELRWLGKNDSSASVTLAVMCDGRLCRNPNLK